MMSDQKLISLGILISLALLLTACGAPLLKADNPLIKADTDSLNADPPAETIPSAENTLQPSGSEDLRSQDMITITLVFDNYPYKLGLETAWGFSAFITYKDQNLLFDTGGDGNMLLRNMEKFGIKAPQIQNVVLSHEHSDHTGGMQALVSAGADPKVYLPPGFSSLFKNQYSRQVEVIEVTPGIEIMDRIYSTGEMQGPPPEQALVIDTTKGLIVITGCAHPGIADIVVKAKQDFNEDIYLVLGGFHLGNASDSQINGIISELKHIGVKFVAPCHCTGDGTIARFRDAFGENFIQVGVGAVIEIEN